MNTRFDFWYSNENDFMDRDETVILAGELQLKQLTAYLDQGVYFIPCQVNLSQLNGKDVEKDHPWHQVSDLTLTADPPTIKMTAAELTDKFKTAHEKGWPEKFFYEEIETTAAEKLNGFFLREPKELSHLTNFTVRFQSDECGSEDFNHFDLQAALEQIIRLYLKVIKAGDNFERRIGLVVTPQVQLADYDSDQIAIVNPPAAQPAQAATDDILTIHRGTTGGQSCQARRQDVIWVCNDLGVGDLDVLEESKTNIYVFNDTVNYDLVRSSLKQKEMLVYKDDKK